MSDIRGIAGFNKSDGTSKLMAAYGNDIVDLSTGLGYGLNLSSTNDVSFEVFLDSLIYQNFNDLPKSFNGTSWSKINVRRCLLSKYIREYGERLYLFHVKIPDINQTFASRVFYSDLPGKDNQIQWGIEWGTNGRTTQNANRLVSANAGFKTYGIKVGDPLFIVSGNQVGKYIVSRISHDEMIEITGTFTQTETNIQFWVGGNWFDVGTNNNDVGMWVGKCNDRLLLYKQDSLFKRGGPGTPLQKVKGGPGTSSGRSVQNIDISGSEVNIYFHGSNKEQTGFYLTDNTTTKRISNAVQPFIDGISSSNYGSVVAWIEGSVYRAWIGDLDNQHSSNKAFNISMSNAVFSYDTITGATSIDPIADQITDSTYLRESGRKKTFVADSANEVFETPSGYSFNGSPVSYYVETYPIYPRGSDIRNEFTKMRIISRDANGVTFYYKRWGNPFEIDQDWQPLGTIKGDVTEMPFKKEVSEMSGIQLRWEETSTEENTSVIEEIVLYSYSLGARYPELKRQV